MAESRKSTINGYQKKEKVRDGVFGKIYHVTKDGQDYALKKLKPFQMTKAVANEIMTEVTILKRLNHGNVVSYVDSFEDGLKELYIVMEYCKLGNLGKLIYSGDPHAAEEKVIVEVMTQLCCGMEYIHSKNVIHRDIKPTNIFIQSNGVIKIGNFGLSKVLESRGYADTLCGTPSYTSPECLTGVPYSYKSDMWAVGRVLFDLCHRGAKQWLPGQQNTIPQRYSDDLRTLLGKLLSVNVSERLPAVTAKAMFSNMNSTSRSSRGGASAEDRESVSAIIIAIGLAIYINQKERK